MTLPAHDAERRFAAGPYHEKAARRGVRVGIRGAVAAFFVMLLVAPALPAAADSATDPAQIGKIGDVHSPDGLSLPLLIGLFVGVPLAAFILSAILAVRSRDSRTPRYRPGRAWNFAPLWFGDRSALEHEPKRAALPGAGGASGRW